jgi:geranylgeranyl diphosphate synthase, type I
MDFINISDKYRHLINQAIKEYLGAKIKELPVFGNSFMRKQVELIEKYCLRNGKRLRPILTLITYEAVGGKNKKDALLPSLAFELYHNYTLIHDDIYDEDDLRRGELSNHILLQDWFDKNYNIKLDNSKLYKDSLARFGVIAGFINGKYLETLSGFPILESNISNNKKVIGLSLLRDVSIYDNTGQAMDLVFELEDAQKVRQNDYYAMALCKTGRLFRAAIEWGAILGDANKKQLEALRKYADEVSLVFQIKDDLLDIASGGDKSRGLGSDIKKGKKTLLMIHALRNANPEQKKQILKFFGKTDASEREIKKVIKLFHKLGSVEYCEKIAIKKAKKAVSYLEDLSLELDEKSKEYMRKLAYFMFKREK